MRLLFASAAALLLSATAAHAEKWREVSESDGKPMAMMFVDTDSVRRTGHTATGWVMTMLEPDPSNRDWTKSIIFRQVDCDKNLTQMLRSKFYSDGGKMLEDNSVPSDWAPVKSGSMVEGVSQALCGTGGYESDVLADPVAFARQFFARGK